MGNNQCRDLLSCTNEQLCGDRKEITTNPDERPPQPNIDDAYDNIYNKRLQMPSNQKAIADSISNKDNSKNIGIRKKASNEEQYKIYESKEIDKNEISKIEEEKAIEDQPSYCKSISKSVSKRDKAEQAPKIEEEKQ